MNYILRPWKSSDVNSLCKYANNKSIADSLRDMFPYPYTREDGEYFINLATHFPKERGFIYAIELNGEAIGNISLDVKDNVYCKTAEVGYWLGEPYWRQGIMTGALSEDVAMAFKNYDICRVYGEVLEDNIGSRHVLEKAGLHLEAVLKKSIYKNGNIYNSCIYAKVKED